MDKWQYLIGNTVMLAVALLLIRMMITNFKRDMEKVINGLMAEDQKIWDRANTHCHRGLDGEGNKVTVS